MGLVSLVYLQIYLSTEFLQMIISAEITPDEKNIRNSSWEIRMDEGSSENMNTGPY
jgi:hypothetical protein